MSFGLIGQDNTIKASKLDSLSTENKSRNFEIIENFPIYDGCEGLKSNAARKECMNQNIASHFRDHFNTVIPENSNLLPGIVTILIAFKVDKNGDIEVISVGSDDDYLINEAKRIALLIPRFKPGYFRDKPVEVPFTLPLKINLKSKENDTFRFPVFRGCNEDLSPEELRKCSIDKIKDFIKVSFDYAIADRALPLAKSTKFQLDFIINKKGKVEQVNAKANHRAIAIEAINTAKRLPKFKVQGTKDNKPVNTPVSLLMTIYF